MHTAIKGCHWYNNGKIQVLRKECPVGFHRGHLKSSRQYGRKNGMYGKHLSEKSKRKISSNMSSMVFWNNGIINKRARECPGEGWTRGRLKFQV